MSDIQQREYYRIFTGTNQEDGYDKIHLGYESNTSEIILKKNKTTYFHMPYFSQSQHIADTTLASCGAIAGPIPALSDRLLKYTGGYEKNTPWGPSETEDGRWLCTWLYSLSGESPIWLDRYFNPGKINLEKALNGNANQATYIKNDPVFYDVPSTLILEPGGLYAFFHNDEKTANAAVKTFSGDDKTRLRLKINNWGQSITDESNYNNTVIIDDFKNKWVKSIQSPGFTDRNVLSFENTDFINAKVVFDDTLKLKNEFTTSFWIYNDNWSEATHTQLLGNFRKGGFGIFYDNLKTGPFFVIPESTYGHLFYFNQDNNFYLEKNIQIHTNKPISPLFVHVKNTAEVIVVYENFAVKYTHLGEITTRTKKIDGQNINFKGTPKLSLLDGDHNTTVVTTSGTYIYDRDLILVSEDLTTPYITNSQICFDINGRLTRELNCIDIKHDKNNNKWKIDTNGNLSFNNQYIFPTLTKCTNIAIDPDDYLWVLHDTNKISKVNIFSRQFNSLMELGSSTTSINNTKNISFNYSYSRELNTHTWNAIVYHNIDQTMYIVTPEGKISNAVKVTQKLDSLDPVVQNQDSRLMTLTCKGDFTGYEWRRIFHSALYQNKHQIHFKIAGERSFQDILNSTYTVSVPVDNFNDRSWSLITCTFKTQQLSLYINGILRKQYTLPEGVIFNYSFENDIFIGSPAGKLTNYNFETNSKNYIWNGSIDDISMYDYAIEPKFIQYFVREKIITQDIFWNYPTAELQYVETINRLFKHRTPGIKSEYFNLKISGSGITDPITKKTIEQELKQNIQALKPAHSELLNIEWID